jgi:glycosyltransferase involved in cell wall biosynthesis
VPAAGGRRVWCVNLFCGPGVAPTGRLLDDLARALADAGYAVEVLTGRVGYNAASADTGPGIFPGRVRRLYAGPLAARGVAGRLLSWLVFTLRVALYAFTHRPPDRVVVLTTPPFLHAAFVLRNLVSRRPAELVLWCQDTYPEVLASVGLLRPRGVVYRLLYRLQRWATRRVAHAVALDGAMADLLRGHGAPDVTVIPNWESAPPAAAPPPEETELPGRLRELRSGYRYLVVYTGNYGWGHDLSTLLDWLRRHPRQRDFFFLFVGGGEKWPRVAALPAVGVECVEVRPYVSAGGLAAVLDAAHFGLVTLERGCVGLMSPSKIHGYLARGKPLLYLGPPGSNVAEAVANYGCGLQIDEGDGPGLERGLAALLDDGFDWAAWSAGARAAYEARYNAAAAHADFLRLLGAGR